MPVRMLKKDEDTNREKGLKKSKMLTGGQAAIAAKAPPPNKIDAKDFAVLRAEKAKGRGMGLQDESVKPGKVMKANLGMLALGIGGKKLMDKNKKELPLGLGAAALLTKKKKEILGKRMGGKIYKAKRGMSFSDKMKAVEDGKINKKTGKPTSMAAMREMKGFKPGESAQDFMKRRKELGAVGKALSATRIGKIALGVGAAGVAAQQYLKGKMNKKKDVKKKMGGGMMQKPMGYSKGGGYDSGTPGKVRDMLNSTVIKEKGKFAKIFGGRPNKRKMEKLVEIGIPKVKKIITSKKYMGGGMMQKPMGYKTGGGYDSGTPGKLRDYSSKFNKDGVTFKNPRVKGQDQSPRLKKLIKRREALNTTKSVLKTLSSVASPVTAAGSAAYKLAKKMKDDGDRLTEKDIKTAKSIAGTLGSKNRPIKKDHSSRNPNPKTPKMMMGGGMMMQRPMGYNKGVMVKARGCKLGRTKPTKIT